MPARVLARYRASFLDELFQNSWCFAYCETYHFLKQKARPRFGESHQMADMHDISNFVSILTQVIRPKLNRSCNYGQI